MKKIKTSKGNHFSSRYGGSKIEEKISQRPLRYKTLVCISVCEEEMVRGFLEFFLENNSKQKNLTQKKKKKKKKKLQKAIISFPDMEVQNFKNKFPSVRANAELPSAFSSLKRKR
jgi:hypothetical protein